MKRITIIFSCLLMTVFLAWSGAFAAALTTGATYTITIQKMGVNGVPVDVSTSTAVADVNGKLSFNLTSMPTNADCNFIVFIVKDASGAIVRRGFVPAPPKDGTNDMGINDLSTAQTNAILAAGVEIGTDDPIAVAYLITMLRSADATAEDAVNLAKMGKKAIINGFETFLTANGVTAAQLATFKSKLIYNNATIGDHAARTIADLTKGFKTANDSTNAATSKEEMQKAGGLMADVFMDAAVASNIDIFLILAAHDAAGEQAEGPEMLAIGANVRKSLEQAMSSFFKRIAIVKVKNEYSNALTALNASGAQVTRFNAAIDTLMTATSAIDGDYAEYYMNPDAYLQAHNTTQAAVQAAMSQAYEAAFTAFQTNMASSADDITALRTAVKNAYSVPDQMLAMIGTYRDFSNTEKNWPIPQTVMVKWMATNKLAGGSFGYIRDTTNVPAGMMWLGTCSNPVFWDQGSCVANAGTWTAGRRNYEGMMGGGPGGPGAGALEYAKFMGLQEDLNIVDFSRYSIYQAGQPTRAQEQEAKRLFFTRLGTLAGLISGKTNATTDMTAAQKKAIIKLIMQPSIY